MKKPDFIGTCEYLELDDQKVLEKRAKIQEEIQSKFRLFEWVSFSTNRFVIKILQKFLPDIFKIKRFPNDNYLISPIIFLTLFVLSLVVSIPIFIKLASSSALLIATIFATYKNYNSLIKEGETIIVLDEKNLTLKTGQKINWREILIVYVYSNFFRSPKLIIKKIFDADAITIDINNTIGQYLILNIIESYRSRTSPNTHHKKNE